MSGLMGLGGWVWEPSVLIGLALLTAGYAVFVGPLRRRHAWGEPVSKGRQICFHLGTLAVFVALVSPLDAFADELLFSAHMVQHILLTFVAPPLWLLGVPGWAPGLLVRFPKLRRTAMSLTQPAIAFMIFNATMWAWHIPFAYDAALQSEPLHIVEHLTFMATAVIGWWPVIQAWPGTADDPRPWRILYLFLSTFPCTALAAVITLAPRQLYLYYAEAPLQVGLSPLLDQQIGGLLMWLPADMILMLAALIVGNRWLTDLIGERGYATSRRTG